MMIHDKNVTEVICNVCGTSEIFRKYKMYEAKARIKQLGWKIRRKKDGPKHYCPVCAETVK